MNIWDHDTYTKRIRGNIEGTTDLSPMEAQMVEHLSFQRLSRIRQTAFLSHVFPGATHTRLAHSLGVLNLAERCWLNILKNQKKILSQYPDCPFLVPIEELKSTLELPRIRQSFRLAALLHDLGHPPFSHSGEMFLPKISHILEKNKISDYLTEYLKGLKDQRCHHEIMTLVLIDRFLPKDGIASAQDVISILCPKIPPKENSPLWNHHIYLFCHRLISGDIDVDRMDYLLRDSKEAGVIYGMFDQDRMLESLVVYSQHQTFQLGLLDSGLAAFEDYLRARQSMYLQLYFHKTVTAAEAMLQHFLKKYPDFYLPSDLDHYISVDDHNFLSLIPDHQKEILEDLILRRKLWKNIYERSSLLPFEGIESHPVVDENHEVILSSVHLTNFKKHFGYSLGFIKKNHKQSLELSDIQQNLSFENKDIQIQRIYAPYPLR